LNFLCAFPERFLLSEFKKRSNSKELLAAFRSLSSGYYDGHMILQPILKSDSYALLLSGLFSYDSELEEDFESRHLRSLFESAENGNGLALYSLGVYFDTGHFVEENKETAGELFKNAASLGVPPAMNIVGIMKYYGTGGEAKNTDQGLEMIKEASRLGVVEATEFLKFIG